MSTPRATKTPDEPRLYDHGGDDLMLAEHAPDRVSLLPGRDEPTEPGQRIRISWGQNMLQDILDGRYRTIVCGVNEVDNSHGIIAQLCELVASSQWTKDTLTSYAKIFSDSVAAHSGREHEPYVLKFDLDRVLILALLRPRGQEHFTLEDLAHGFRTVDGMLRGRYDRLPVASVSFLGARSNRLVDETGAEPTFETVLRTMYGAGYRGDVYPAPQMWRMGAIGVFPSYPFSEALDRMREGGF